MTMNNTNKASVAAFSSVVVVDHQPPRKKMRTTTTAMSVSSAKFAMIGREEEERQQREQERGREVVAAAAATMGGHQWEEWLLYQKGVTAAVPPSTTKASAALTTTTTPVLIKGTNRPAAAPVSSSVAKDKMNVLDDAMALMMERDQRDYAHRKFVATARAAERAERSFFSANEGAVVPPTASIMPLFAPSPSHCPPFPSFSESMERMHRMEGQGELLFVRLSLSREDGASSSSPSSPSASSSSPSPSSSQLIWQGHVDYDLDEDHVLLHMSGVSRDMEWPALHEYARWVDRVTTAAAAAATTTTTTASSSSCWQQAEDSDDDEDDDLSCCLDDDGDVEPWDVVSAAEYGRRMETLLRNLRVTILFQGRLVVAAGGLFQNYQGVDGWVRLANAAAMREDEDDVAAASVCIGRGGDCYLNLRRQQQQQQQQQRRQHQQPQQQKC